MLVRLPNVSESCHRTILRFVRFGSVCAELEPAHLFLAMLQEESLGAECLKTLGLNVAAIVDGCLGKPLAELADEPADEVLASSPPDPCNKTAANVQLEIGDAIWFRSVLERANSVARRATEATPVTTQHIVLALGELPGVTQEALAVAGINPLDVVKTLGDETAPVEPVAVDFDLDDEPQPAPVDSPATVRDREQHSDEVGVAAAVDANLNRAREGLRVVDDYARFVLRNSAAMTLAKSLRHDLVAAEQTLRNNQLQLKAARSVESDPGTTVTLPGESKRISPNDVAAANIRRVQEALRSLEEFGKLLSVEFSASVKQLRYRSYELEQQLVIPASQLRRQRLQRSHLYVLITESLCRTDWKTTAKEVLAGGADVLQLREKQLSDDEFLLRARWLAELCHEHNALMIVNDRTDLVAESGADGLHLGQEDGCVQAASQQIGNDLLLGLSTHTAAQLSAVDCSAVDYVGVGPVFASSTKSFTDFAGLEFVGAACEQASLPWFPIGGIANDNLAQVIEAGATRAAICGAVIGSEDPQTAARELRQQLVAGR